jgi:uroporphyrinogen decarboxylase
LLVAAAIPEVIWNKATMNCKERMRRSLMRQPIDRIPVQVNYTTRMGENIARLLGVAPEALPQRLGNHLLRLEVDTARRLSPDGKVAYDEWGAGWSTEQEGYYLEYAPLREQRDLDAIAWPDAGASGLFDGAAHALEADGGAHFSVPNFGFSLFERAWSLRGFENFLADTALDPTYAGELLDRVVDVQVARARRFVALGVDGGYFGDDYGGQQALLISPRAWRILITPRLALLFAPFREAGLPIILHSDGQIKSILPDLIEIGLTTINPVQPEVLEHRWLQTQYGDALAFYGGVSTQSVLPYGTPVEVRTAVRACAQALAPEGTGLVIGPSHRMMTDIPMENVAAMLEALEAI